MPGRAAKPSLAPTFSCCPCTYTAHAQQCCRQQQKDLTPSRCHLGCWKHAVLCLCVPPVAATVLFQHKSRHHQLLRVTFNHYSCWAAAMRALLPRAWQPHRPAGVLEKCVQVLYPTSQGRCNSQHQKQQEADMKHQASRLVIIMRNPLAHAHRLLPRPPTPPSCQCHGTARTHSITGYSSSVLCIVCVHL
jgi:hypothetical protein